MPCRTGAELHRIKAVLQSSGGCDSCICVRGDVWEKLPSAKFSDTLLTRHYNSQGWLLFSFSPFLKFLFLFLFYSPVRSFIVFQTLFFFFKAFANILSYCFCCFSFTAADKHLTLSGPVLHMRCTAWLCGQHLALRDGSLTRCPLLVSYLVTLISNSRETYHVLHTELKNRWMRFPRQPFRWCKLAQLLCIQLTIKREQIKACKVCCCYPYFADSKAESEKRIHTESLLWEQPEISWVTDQWDKHSASQEWSSMDHFTDIPLESSEPGPYKKMIGIFYSKMVFRLYTTCNKLTQGKWRTICTNIALSSLTKMTDYIPYFDLKLVVPLLSASLL